MVGRGRPGNHQAKIARLGGVVQTQEVSLLPDRGKSKGRPRRERLFLHSQPGLKQSREALPRPRRWARRPRHRDAETQRRGLPLPVWRGGGARGAFWFVYKEAPPALGGYEPALESQCPGGCRQQVRWFSPPSPVVLTPAAEEPPPPVQPEAGEGPRLSCLPCVCSWRFPSELNPYGRPVVQTQQRSARVACAGVTRAGGRVGSPSRNTLGA